MSIGLGARDTTRRCSDISETARKPDLPYNYCCSTAPVNAVAHVRLYLRSQLKAELFANEEQQKESRTWQFLTQKSQLHQKLLGLYPSLTVCSSTGSGSKPLPATSSR